MDDPTYEDMVHFLKIEKQAPTNAMQFINEAIYYFTKKHGTGKPNMMDAHVRCGYDPGGFIGVMSSESPAAIALEWLEERWAVVSADQIDQLFTGVAAPEDKDLYDKEP